MQQQIHIRITFGERERERERERESSIMNEYRPTINSSDANDINTGFQMLIKSKENERVMQKLCLDHVASLKYHRDSKTWRCIDAKDAVLGFPVYQIKQANSYVAEHLKNG